MGKGADTSQNGMYAALASAQEAQTAYKISSDNLDWAKQQWNEEQPYVKEVADTQAASQKQLTDFSQQQEDMYKSTYQPLEEKYAQQAQGWASPAQVATNVGAAQASVADAMEGQKNSSIEQLEGYGVNPGATRFSGLNMAANIAAGAASAGAGTQAIQNTKLQQLGLEAGAINTGRGVVNSTEGLSTAGTNAGSAGANTTQSNITTGSNAMTAPSAYINAGSNAMGVYTNAVNGYNQAQAGVAAGESAGLGSALGGIAGMFKFALNRGGAVRGIPRYADGGNVGSGGVTQPLPTAMDVPDDGTPGGPVPASASPTRGGATDDVDAKLTAGEFVMPKDVVSWKGQEHFIKQIDKARQEQQIQQQRGDIGGEPTRGIPARNPAFVSRPLLTGSGPNMGGIKPRGIPAAA